MSSVFEVNEWIAVNVLESEVWDQNADKQGKAVIQAERNLQRWYPTALLTSEVVAYQAIWELQSLDPALKYQKQGVKSVSDNGERIDYTERDKVAPEVRQLLGPSVDEINDNPPLYGGCLV